MGDKKRKFEKSSVYSFTFLENHPTISFEILLVTAMAFFKRSNILFIPFLVLTTSIVVLCLLSQVLINTYLKDLDADNKTLDLAKKQRVLSLQIVNELAADNLAGIITGLPVDSLTNVFVDGEGNILKGDSTDGVKPLEKTFWPEYYGMDKVFKNLHASINFIANSDNNNKAFVELLNRQEGYIRAVDKFVYTLHHFSNGKIRRFQQNETLIMIGSLLVVFLEVVLFFLPAINRIKKQSLKFKAIAYEQSHVIRQPLANLKGLLNLMDKNEHNEDIFELITLAKAEAEKLDNAIKNTVHTTKEG